MTTKSRSFLMIDMEHSMKQAIHELASGLGYKSTSEYVRVLITAQIQIHKNTGEVISDVK